MNELGRLSPGFALASAETTHDRFGELRLLEGIQTVMSILARERPILIILDDAQWMDTSSAALFSYLARRISEMPVVMVVAARAEDDLLPAVAEMIGAADQSAAIRPLTVQHLLPLVGGDENAARRLREKTGGVPLLVNEALAADLDNLPATPGMTRYMEARLLEIDDLGRQILTAAAALNGICDATLLRETSGRSEEEVVQAVEELVAAGMLREIPESEGLSFTLDALERVTYEATSHGPPPSAPPSCRPCPRRAGICPIRWTARGGRRRAVPSSWRSRSGGLVPPCRGPGPGDVRQRFRRPVLRNRIGAG